MDNYSIENNYLAKQQEVNEASKVMDNALRSIAKIFKNFQVDYLSVLEDNKKLRLLVDELEEGKNQGVEDENDLVKGENDGKLIVQGDVIDHVAITSHDVETQGIIQSTLIDEQVLCKLKSRNSNKQSKSQINIFHKNKNNNGIETSSSSTLVDAELKSEKQLCGDTVNGGIIISPDVKTSKFSEVVIQPVVSKTNVNVYDKVDLECLNIDVTLFEQPFSQEFNLNSKSPESTQLNNVKTVQGNLHDTSHRKFFQDDVVETSPKKNISRKKHSLRYNRQNLKSCINNSNLDVTLTSNVHDNDAVLTTKKLFQCVSRKEEEKQKNSGSIKNKTTPRISNKKINIFSQRTTTQKESSVLINNSTFFSYPSSPVVSPQKNPISSVSMIIEKDQNDINALNVLDKISSQERNSDETFFPGDETYFSRYEISPYKDCNKNSDGILNKAKRKFADLSKSTGKEIEKSRMSVMSDLDIEEMSDWEPDIECDKLTPITHKKRLLDNSFDILPVKKEATPKFATKGPVVRNKLAREKLRGWDCENCENYYVNMKLTEKELQDRKNQCSRHRSKFNERYYSPPGLWDLRFPDTQNSSQE